MRCVRASPARPALNGFHDTIPNPKKQAKAFAAWLSRKEKASSPYRLTTEAEHHLLRGAEAFICVWKEG